MTNYPRYYKLDVKLDKYVGPGWLPLIEELITELDERFPGWTCIQIKEKFGGLRFYAEPPEGISFPDNPGWFQAIIDPYEQRSFKICEICGKPGNKEPGSHEKDNPFRWIKTRCDKHKE